MKKLLSYILLTVLVLFSVNMVNASTSLDFTKGTVNESGVLTENVTFESFTAQTYTDAGTLGNQNISYVMAASDAPIEIVAWSVLGNGKIIGSDIIEIAEDYELHHPGYEVVAGINGDYYDAGSATTINALVQDGTTVKHSNFYLDRYFSIGFTNDDELYIANKSNSIENKFILTIYDEYGMIIKETYLDGTNRAPSDDETTFYYDNLNQVVLSETYMIEADITVMTNYGSLMLQGTLSDEVITITTEDDKAVIATKNEEIENYLKNGYSIRVQKVMAGVYAGVDNIIGVGSQPLEDNMIKEFEDINDQNVAFAQARHPRSSFGFTESGDFIIAAIDGRQTNMDGVNLREMALVMQELGCVQAFNLDGGGSTQVAIKEDGEFRMLNSPSDVPYRNVMDGILIVRPIADIEGVVDNLTTDGFDFSYSVSDSNLVDADISVYLDDTLLDLTENAVSITDLDTPEIYNISVVATWQDNGNDYTSILYQDTIYLLEESTEEPSNEKNPPTNFNITFAANDSINGFTVTIQFDDPDDTFVKLYVEYDDESILCSKTSNGYKADVSNAIDGKVYALKLEVYYTNERFQVVSQISDATYYYTYSDGIVDPGDDIVDPGDETPEEPENVNLFLYIAAPLGFVGLVATGITVFMLRKRKL